MKPFKLAAGLSVALAGLLVGSVVASPSPSPYAQWSRGPSSDLGFFPLAVWLQAPANAAKYRQAGFNTYVGLWKGPTEEQLATLKQAGMRLICDQNEVALRHLEDPAIIAWMHGDEPDNAQSLGEGKGWGDPIAPDKIVADYQRLRKADPSRPVFLNLGQGVAWDGWYGRGPRTRHPEDYPQYLKGCDIASFDIYPATHDNKEVAGNLWFVARGVERLVQWSEGKKVVWNALECTRISNPDRKPTPHEVRAEAWMSLIHGSRGLIFFVHQFKPVFREAALLEDREMLEAITALNLQITQLAPVLNSPSISKGVEVQSTNPSVPVSAMLKHHDGMAYLFMVGMRQGSTSASFRCPNAGDGTRVEVLGESRSIPIRDGAIRDDFSAWQVHVYRWKL
ncbi:MAG TPA: hypothetical protein VEC99_07720 [Clostridia bacterium]|nr:hypothetical protein [Clostridia bacterium]